jgi:hypothetical protein
MDHRGGPSRRVFTVSRPGGDRKPAVRVVVDALVAEAQLLSSANVSANPGVAALGSTVSTNDLTASVRPTS